VQEKSGDLLNVTNKASGRARN